MTKGGHIGSRLRVGRLGLAQAAVGGFPHRPQGFPVLCAHPASDSKVRRIADHRLRSQGSALLEVLPKTRGFVIATQCRIDSPIHHSGTEPAWGTTRDPPLENQGNLIRSPYVQVITNNSFKPHTTGLRLIEHAGLGYLHTTFALSSCS